MLNFKKNKDSSLIQTANDSYRIVNDICQQKNQVFRSSKSTIYDLPETLALEETNNLKEEPWEN